MMDEQQKILAEFIKDNQDLERLEELINYFNIFKALDLSRNELKHSKFLSWLLNPSETHGLGDYFLRLLLKRVAIDPPNANAPTVFDIDSWDFDDSEIFRERYNIDILILSENNKLCVAIENKIDTSEHSEQLEKYRIIIESSYPDFKHLFIYLTIDGDLPSDDNYIKFGYSDIIELVERLISAKEGKVSDEILMFIKHYDNMLRREIMGKSEIEELCTKIYKQHKAALDLIYENKEDMQSKIYETLLDLLKNKQGIILEQSSKGDIRFLPESFEKIPKRGEGWVKSGRILLFEFFNPKDKLILYLWIGPSPDQELRDKLFRIAEKDNTFDIFRKQHAKWTRIYRKTILNQKQLEELDEIEIIEVVSKHANDFFSKDMKVIEEKVAQGVTKYNII